MQQILSFGLNAQQSPTIFRQIGRRIGCAAILSGLLACSSFAVQAESNGLEAALRAGSVSLNQRLRVETVEQDGIEKDATAFTLRTRLGYKTASWHAVTAFVEYEGIAAFGGRNYAPEASGRPVVLDPTGDELNRWWLQYSGLADTSVKLGRQRLVVNNARVIGNVGWRQNEQTFDGLTVTNQSFSNTTITAAHLSNSNFINFQNLPLDAQLINVANSSHSAVDVAVYALRLDFKLDTADTQTMGLRLSGKFPLAEKTNLAYTAEYARQQDTADNPDDFSAAYLHAELGLSQGRFGLKLGYESLGSDDGTAVQFPLATLHKFNGWADKFLNTPANGLEDRYIGLSAKLAGTQLALMYHDFAPTESGADYGSEVDFLIARPLAKNLKLVAKYADYRADSFASNTQKISLQLDYSF